MKLSRLAKESGVTTTTLKHWIRVGILPAGDLKNQTTAVYGQRHLDRARLLLVLRDVYGASTSAIRSLTRVIDDERLPLVEVMNACQEFALGVPEDIATDPAFAEYAARTHELMRRREWRGYPGAAERGLTAALAQASEVGLDYDVETLMVHADALEPLAFRHVQELRPDGSPDEIARTLLLAINARARQLVAVSSLAHAAASIRTAIERGVVPADIAKPPAG